MSKIKAFFKLVRWPNLVMVALMMLLVYYFLMSPLFFSGIPAVMAAPPAFALLLLAMIFIVAGGYVINDYFDVEIDKLNKPDKQIVTQIFTLKETKTFYVILTFLGLAFGLASSIIIAKTKFLTLFAMLVLLAGVLYSYSSTYKKKVVVGNIIVSLSVAFSVFLPWLFEMLYLSNNILILSAAKEIMMSILPYVMIYTLFAFLMTFIREIVKDAEDYKGDLVTHCRTIPIVYGIKTMNIILIVLSVILYFILFVFAVNLLKMQSYIALGIIFVILVCMPIFVMQITNKKTDVNYHSYSIFLKLMMLLGVLSMMFI